MTSNEKLLSVKINHHGLIPLVGPGPIVVPIKITETAKATIEALIGKGKIVVLDGQEEVKVVVEETPVTPDPVVPVEAPVESLAVEQAPEETPQTEEVVTDLVEEEEEVVEEEIEAPQPSGKKKKNK